MNRAPIRFLLISSASAALAILASGCATDIFGNPTPYGIRQEWKIQEKKNRIWSAYFRNPDADAWYSERQQIVDAIGQRDYDNVSFDRVFDSVVLALGSLEVPVVNMERQSGYLLAEGLRLSPSESQQYRHERIRAWATVSGYDAQVLDVELKTIGRGWGINYDVAENEFGKVQKTLTLQLVRLAPDRTRVKARFSNVLYPKELSDYYERIWSAVDKQIFIDDNLDGKRVDQ